MAHDIKNFIDTNFSVDTALGRVALILHPHQRQMIDDLQMYPDLFFLQARGVGVTTTLLAYVLHEMTFHNGREYMIVSPNATVSASKFNSFERMYRYSNNLSGICTSTSQTTPSGKVAVQMMINNGSTIEFCEPHPDMFRGKCTDVLVLDNCDHMNPIDVDQILTNGQYYNQIVLTGNAYPACCQNYQLHSTLVTVQNNITNTPDLDQILSDNYDRAMSIV